MKRAVFMGSDTFSLAVLTRLLDRGETLSVSVRVTGVVTQPDRPAGRGRRPASRPVKALAERAGVPTLQPEKVRDSDAVEQILALRPDVIVVASYGQILPAALLEAPPGRALNLHPSLLPRYRGSSPVAAPILAGDAVTGTTLMLMSTRMDAGPILDQRTLTIGPEENGGELMARLAEASAELLLEDLPLWLSGEIKPREQLESQATYTPRLTKSDGEIEWGRPAREIDRHIRAFTPWPGAHTEWEGTPIRILAAAAVEGSARPGLVRATGRGELSVGTGEGLLLVRSLQPAGGKIMPADAFLHGRPGIIGKVLGP